MKLSVVIPTLNEEDYLPETINKIRENAANGEPHEIIVADSGSADGTPEIALGLGVVVIECENHVYGRASALNCGADHATGDVILFLDADTIPPPGYDECIESALESPGTVGGAFEFSLDGQELGLRVVEALNRVRYRVRQRYYGDQGVFVRASVFRKIGGYPKRRILETAYLCEALQAEGRLKLVDRKIDTSPRRFLNGGIYRVFASDIKIWLLDLLGVSVERYADQYWKENATRR